MNKTLMRTLFVAMLAAVVVASLAVAQPWGMRGMGAGMHGGRGNHGGEMGPFGHLGKLQEKLNLSDTQVTQIKTIFQDARAQNATAREQLKGGAGAAFQLLLANPNDLAGAQKALDQQIAAERTLKANMLGAVSKALNVLTPAQRTELSKLIAERAAHRRQ